MLTASKLSTRPLCGQWQINLPADSMTPTEANFNGAKGIRLNNPSMPGGGFFKLRRGNKLPSNCLTEDFKQQLLWFMPVGEEPQLLWCDPDDNWYELSFNPIKKP
jgi:hypothetical protein